MAGWGFQPRPCCPLCRGLRPRPSRFRKTAFATCADPLDGNQPSNGQQPDAFQNRPTPPDASRLSVRRLHHFLSANKSRGATLSLNETGTRLGQNVAMDNQLPVIYIARHGETAWTITGQHTGLTDLPLTPQGESNARGLAGRLKGLGFAKVFTSPL